MTSTTIWLTIGLCFCTLAAIANGSFFTAEQATIATVGSAKVWPQVHSPGSKTTPPALKSKAEHKLPSQVNTKPALSGKPSSAGIEVVAGTDATRLKDYLREFEVSTTGNLEERLADLERDVAAADYFRRANSGDLDFAETMAFDDLLRRQEAIHLILLSRKLARLKQLTAKL